MFAILILKTAVGEAVFAGAQRGVTKLNEFAMQGAGMVFGPLANASLLGEKWGPGNAFILAINISATIIVVSALSSLLYHWGILQRVVRAMAVVMQRGMRTSGSETLAAAANIFMANRGPARHPALSLWDDAKRIAGHDDQWHGHYCRRRARRVCVARGQFRPPAHGIGHERTRSAADGKTDVAGERKERDGARRSYAG